MNFTEDIKDGIQKSADSFYFLWNNTSILFYLSILLYVKIALAFLSASCRSCTPNSFVSFLLMHAPVQFLMQGFIFFAQVCIAYHCNDIVKKIPTSIYSCIKKAHTHYIKIILWTSINFLILFFFKNVVRIYSTPNIEAFLGLLASAATTVTIFVPVSIAIDSCPFLKNITNTVEYFYKHFFFILGGLLWLGLVNILSMIFFSGSYFVNYVAPQIYSNFIFLQIICSLNFTVQWVINSAYAVFISLIYLKHKN